MSEGGLFTIRMLILSVLRSDIQLLDLDDVGHFWAYDGIAAWGLPGILVISVVCALVFWLLDSAAQRHDPRFAGLVTCYAAYNLANISLFTSLAIRWLVGNHVVAVPDAG